MIWDVIPSTSGIEERVASWRGNGTFDAPQFSPKAFTLSVGVHTLTIRGREANTIIDRLAIQMVTGSLQAPANFRFNSDSP